MRPLLLACLALTACDAYDTDLGPTPFLCGEMGECPTGYSCQDDPATGKKVCVSDNDSLSSNFSCADDSDTEPNETLDQATVTPLDGMKTYSLENRAICPARDVDNYAIMIATANEGIDATLTFEAGGAPLRAAIRNTGGVPIMNLTGVSGQPTMLHAAVQNLPVDKYFFTVSSQLGGSISVNNYKFTLTVTAP